MVQPHSIYELDVRLKEIEPPIWRTIEVAGKATLEDVHYAIQLAMGWTNSHLHQFAIGKRTYGMMGVDELARDLEDECEHLLQDVAKSGSSFTYEYDFGDGWEHGITVKRVTTSAKPARPRCTSGARACPPEDCGGPHGYQRLLAALADPKHEEHAELIEWVPQDFDPEAFVTAGKDLSRDIEELRHVADGDSEDVEDDDDLLASLPRPLVEATLALHPMQRASLVALLAGSLANDVVSIATLLEEKSPSAGRRKKRGNGGATTRSR